MSSEATLSRTQMAERLKMGLDTVKEYLRKLREKGYIERLGGNRRTGRWVVKK
ncbi:winged helix-turn-helix transcriptional regulator [uncultured Parabacteroides sp.]|uniref:winged helix-turn-helix transcriptional regulator n=1 Tax=uncultured Parabacteroides sp. TaxID=512312 RepID=UPI0034A471A1